MRDGHAKTGSILGATLALIFTCLMTLAPSHAGAGWTAPTIVSGAGNSTSQTTVAGASDGSSWVVWKRDVGGFDVIQATRVAIDGTQGPIETISAPAMDATDPVVASRADGSAMVAWLNLSATEDTVHSRSIAANGALGPIETRSGVGPVGQPAKDVAIALGDDGSAALSWLKFDGTNWIAQAVKVGADGSSGTIHDLSDPAVNAGAPDIAGIPPVAVGVADNYRVFWPQGAGTDSNVGARDLNSDDTITDLVEIFATGDNCQDSFDMNLAFGKVDGAMNAIWVCYRNQFDSETAQQYYNWSVQWLRVNRGSPILPGANVANASPSSMADPYKINGVAVTETYGGQPIAVWNHELPGGDERLETWRIRPNGTGQIWDNPGVEGTSVEKLAIAGNASPAAIAGGVVPGLLPGDSTASWARFSFSALDPLTPGGGDIVSTDDPGFAMADNGKTLAAFTAINAGDVGSVRVMTYADPGIRVDPGNFNYGRLNIGRSSTVSVTIRSAGQTPNEVTGIALSGSDAARYRLNNANQCVREMESGSNCRFEVIFTPGSTATQNAALTVTSEAGNRVVNLTGSGLNRTRNRITLNKRNFSARKGKVVRIRAKASNRGGVASNGTKVCVNLRKRVLRLAGNRCRTLGVLPAGATRTLNFRVRVTWRARRGARLPVTFRMRANNAVVRQVVANVRRKGR